MDIKEQIKKDLSTLGIKAGDIVLMHSSLKALGYIEGGIKTFIDAILEHLTEEGTLFVPALSYESVNKDHPIFDIKNTPACIGAIPEYFRTVDGVYRSLCPTHSVCGKGKLAKEILSNQLLDETPVGEHSAFKAMRDYKGKLLFVGCGLKPNTSMHGVEELVNPYYLFKDESIEYDIIDYDGNHHKASFRRHNFSNEDQRYDRILDVLAPEDYSKGNILNAVTYVLDAKAVWNKGEAKMKEVEDYFIDKRN